MPWKECSVMDERLQFVARRLANGGSLQGVWDLAQDGLQNLRSLPGVWGARVDGPKPTALPQCASASLPGGKLHPEREARARELGCARFASASCADSPEFPSRPRAPSMRCSIAMAWSSAAAVCVVGPKEPLYPLASVPMNCGAPITRASSCSPIVSTAIR